MVFPSRKGGERKVSAEVPPPRGLALPSGICVRDKRKRETKIGERRRMYHLHRKSTRRGDDKTMAQKAKRTALGKKSVKLIFGR